MRSLKAFSMMELMVCVVAISIMAAAMAPAIIRKQKKAEVIVNSNQLSPYCSAFSADCNLCYQDKCVVCMKDCGTFENINIAECKCISE